MSIFGLLISWGVPKSSRHKHKSRHPDGPHCPKCGHYLPELDNDESSKHVPIGGYTCPYCKCRVDESGNELLSSGNNEDPSCW